MTQQPESTDPIASAGQIDDPDQPTTVHGKDDSRAGRDTQPDESSADGDPEQPGSRHRSAGAPVRDDAATEVVHGLSRAALVPRPEPGAAQDPLASRLEREGLDHPVLLFSGALTAEAAQRYVRATAGTAACSAVLVVAPPLVRPAGADVLEAAGWSVVLVSRWTDVDAAWLAVASGGSLMAPPPPEPGAPQLSVDDVMGRTRTRTTA